MNNALAGRRIVLLFIFVGLAVMLAASMSQRMANPSLEEFRQAEHGGGGQQNTMPPASGGGMGGMNGAEGGAPQGMGSMDGGEGVMGDVRGLMERVKENPDDVEALVKLGNAFAMMKAWDRALDIFQQASKADPTNLDAKRGLGITFFQKGGYGEALEIYMKILEAEPDDELALFNSGFILFNNFDKPAEARPYFEKLLSLPNIPEDLKGMASAQLEQLNN